MRIFANYAYHQPSGKLPDHEVSGVVRVCVVGDGDGTAGVSEAGSGSLQIVGITLIISLSLLWQDFRGEMALNYTLHVQELCADCLAESDP
jgi:hypothetical protein